MKTVDFLEWNDLTKEEKNSLGTTEVRRLFDLLIEHGSEFLGIDPESPVGIEIIRCWDEVERLRTPWFIRETLRESQLVLDYLLEEAKEILYRQLYFRVGSEVRGYYEFTQDETEYKED